jgi:hypothetical protein
MGSLLLLDASALLYLVWKDEDELGGRAAGGRHPLARQGRPTGTLSV